jgi:Holliday junction resolvase
MNSREKGKRGERQWRDELREQGFAARRGQQFSGGTESPDVVCDSLPWMHFEVKAVERLNIEEAMEQARRDAGTKVPVVAHKRSFRRWLVTMDAADFFKILRGDFEEVESAELRVESRKSEVNPSEDASPHPVPLPQERGREKNFGTRVERVLTENKQQTNEEKESI